MNTHLLSPNPAYALLPQSLLFSNIHSKMTGVIKAVELSSVISPSSYQARGKPCPFSSSNLPSFGRFLFCSSLTGPPVFNFPAASKLLQGEGVPRLLQRAEDRQNGTVGNDQEYAESKGADSQHDIFGMVKRRDRRLRSWAQYQNSFQTSLASGLP